MKKFLIFALAIISSLNILAQEDISNKYTVGQMKIGGGGFITAIIGDNERQYARTDVGGVYKRNLSDGSWEFMSNHITTADKGLFSTDGLCLGKKDGNNYTYVLSGCNYFSHQKTALIKYTNDQNPEIIDLTSYLLVHGNGDGRNCGERVACSKDGNIVYAVGRATPVQWQTPIIKYTNGNIERVSTNGLENPCTIQKNWNWGERNVWTTEKENGFTCVAVNPEDPTFVVVGIEHVGGQSLYYLQDNGANPPWQEITLPNTSCFPTKLKFIDGEKLLIVTAAKITESNENSYAYIYNVKSKTFKDITPSNFRYKNGDDDQRAQIGDIAVCPTDPNKMVITSIYCYSGVQNWTGTIDWSTIDMSNFSGWGSLSWGDKLGYTTDGGNTWNIYSIQNFYLDNPDNISWVNKSNVIHWCSSLCFYPGSSTKISASSGNGIFTCDNFENNSSKIVFNYNVKGIEELVSLDLISVPGDKTYSVAKDYGGFIHTSPNEFAPLLDYQSGNTCAIAYYKDESTYRMVRLSKEGLHFSADGTSWSTNNKDVHSNETIDWGKGIKACYWDGAKCAIDKNNIYVLAGGNNPDLYISSDNGYTLNPKYGISAKWVGTDPNQNGIVYLCGDNSFMYSKDGGNSFTKTSTKIGDGNSYRCATVIGKAGYVYLPGEDGLYFSDTYGETFTKITTIDKVAAVGTGKGLDGVCDYAIYVYGGSPVGIYRSLDYGKTWKLIREDKYCYGGTGNGNYIVGDNNVFGQFYMSTIGMGVIYGQSNETFDKKIAHWISTSSTDWNEQSNWDVNQVPDKDYQVIIDANTADPIISDIQEVKSLEFLDNQILTITSNGALTLEDATIGKGKIILSQTDENSDLGTFIYTGELDGKIQIEKKLRIGWNRISTPFNITDRVYTFSDKTFFNASLEKFDSEYTFSSDEMNDRDVKGTLANAWEAAHTGNKSNIATNLKIGEGYHFYNFDNVKTIVTSGIPVNQASYSVSTINSNGNAQYSGWTFAGNPFTSYLDLAEFFKSNSGTTVYVLDYVSGNYITATKDELNNLKTIKNCQGFFVHYGTEAGAHEIIFGSEQQCAKADASSLSKKQIANRLELSLNDDNTIIKASEDYSDEFENGIDAIKLNNENSNIYSISNNLNLAINCVNINNLDQKEIALGFNCKNTGENSIEVKNLTFDQNDVYLIDKMLKDTINLKEENQYKFVGENSNERFSILISKKAVNQEDVIMGIDNIKSEGISIYPNPFVDKISINLNEKHQKYSIINANGQIILADKITKNNFEIDLSNLPSGIYIIKLDNQNFKIIKK